jgi:hypothetical protein
MQSLKRCGIVTMRRSSAAEFVGEHTRNGFGASVVVHMTGGAVGNAFGHPATP